MPPSAQVKLAPALTSVSIVPDRTPVAVTATATLLLVVEPFPSWPLAS